ncbi:hypothetical protein [Ruminococcus sp.]|nr:hypothetical protein [Ruminococcus sp.]HNZ98577.1 hypothetical protein [Ruminococcus sp.]HOH87160.1 hypothetical protein [Ruminococcus sp.]
MISVYIAGTGGGQAFGTAQGADMEMSEAVLQRSQGIAMTCKARRQHRRK